MNIGIDLRPFIAPHRTGVGEYTYELLSAVFAQDTTNEYFLYYNSAKNVASCIPRWEQSNVHYVTTHWSNKLFNASVAVFNRPCIDQLIIKKSQISNLLAGQAGLKLDYFYSSNFNFTALSPSTKYILTVHDIAFLLFPSFYNYRWRLKHTLIRAREQCEIAHHIITPSKNTKNDLINHFGIADKKISVIYPGLSPHFDHFRNADEPIKLVAKQTVKQKYHLPDNFILYLGTIEPRKNIVSIIKAFEQIANTSLQSSIFNLVIAGAPGWKNKATFAAIENSPVKKHIRYIGYVDAEDKPALVSLASLFVYPSFYEGFGFPVLEAMSLGIPVITSNRSSLPEITGGSTYLVHPHRTEEIAASTIKLLTDTALAASQTKKALARASHFHYATAAQQWLSLLH